MKSFLPYPSYKPTNFAWVEKIPAHWSVWPVQRLLDSYDGIKIGPFGSQLKSDFIQSEGIKVFGQENLINDDFQIGDRYISVDKFNELAVYEIKAGDIVISMMGTVGKCKIVPQNIEKGIMDSHLIRIRIRGISKYFFSFLIDKAKYIKDQFLINNRGSIMQGLNSTIIKELIILIPTLPEQQRIAAFLDAKTALIDSLVTKYTRLIDLLQEKRSSLITHAVTGKIPSTLPPNTLFKPSDVSWLGAIPSQWKISPLGFLSYMIVPMRDKPTIFNGDIPWIRIEDFSGKYISDTKSDQRVSQKTVASMNLKVFPVDTVLCSCSCNMGATAIVKKPLISNQTFIGIVPNKKLSSEYLYYLMNAVSKELNSVSTGAIQLYLSRNDFEHFKIPVPSFSEQTAITNFLDRETSKIDQSISKIHDLIARLKEYRSALITAAVTGQIDLRSFSSSISASEMGEVPPGGGG